MKRKRKPVRLDAQLKRLGCVRSTETLPPVERSGLITVWKPGVGWLREPHTAPQGYDFDAS
jgi:hypothetical protein